MFQSERRQLLRQMMRVVHRALTSFRRDWPGARIYYKADLPVPGLLDPQHYQGHAVADLILPEVEVPVEARETLVWQAVSCLDERPLLRDLLDRAATDFLLLEDTVEARLVRLLWFMGQDLPREVGEHTLLVHLPTGPFGVREGHFVGGPYAGLPIDLPVNQVLRETRTVTTQASRFVEVRRVLASRTDQTAFTLFCILYAVAEWDKTLPLDSLVLPKPRYTRRTLDNLARSLMEDSDPHRLLYKKLVPVSMTYTDYRNIFGNPERRGNISQAARITLINKVYMLPFFE